MKKTIKFDADRPVSRKQIRNFGFYKDLAKSIEMHEVFDEKGERISGARGIQIYKGDLVVFSDNAIYTNSEELKKMFKGRI